MRTLLACLIAPFVGVAALTGRHIVSGGIVADFSEILRVVALSQKDVGLMELLFFFLGGVLLALIGGREIGRRRSLAVSGCAIALLPVVSIIDLALGRSPHNLLPIEWLIYCFYGVVVFAGVSAGRGLTASRRAPG